ncbi:periplasmic glucans biosynthesis protein [Beggiatoa alba B18LD]|uniref:Glucans biosynthesis protein G n=1 Tax=Beggiatoa alba B18LD TaxID=395493 RepID=I3CFL4_9GAMM|nr:glucan biosynthesis protein G [Beggiatoa alba]EIJ42407.1 periplasmic glucans biosynthesis protein [Beggiatoa alba B18LD]
MVKRTVFLLSLASTLSVSPLSMSNSYATPEIPSVETIKVADSFNFANVHRRAAELATQPFKEDTSAALPDYLVNLGYDQYRDLRFRTDKSLWLKDKLPFIARFFHRGFLYNKQVKINIVDEGIISPLEYSRDLFTFGKTELPSDMPATLGFAGFQLFYPLINDENFNEFASFVGASYFRAVGKNQHWGLSARGLAINTGNNEEFPYFSEFWLEKPNKDATSITVYALLESKSVTGAYRFTLSPSIDTVISVKASIFPREKVAKLGISPLTSMFYHGENTDRFQDDFRPEVHDSDGLLMANGSGEWIWRPLNNPQDLRINSFSDDNPRGFGLMQRDRDFNNYQDLESFYHQRPSAWIEPIGQWGKGVVQLVEIPTDAERNDNIVLFWVPEKPIEKGDEVTFEYRIRFMSDDEQLQSGGRVISTRIGRGGSDSLNEKQRKFVIEFSGNALENLPIDTVLDGVVSSTKGKIINKVVQKNPFTKGYRLFFELEVADQDPVELRAFLKRGNDVLTETWSYQWNPTKK